jgi:hypothetical protein
MVLPRRLPLIIFFHHFLSSLSLPLFFHASHFAITPADIDIIIIIFRSLLMVFRFRASLR